MNTILVTGGKGMIGSELICSLLKIGYRVISVDRIGDATNDGNLQHYAVDLSDKDQLMDIIVGQRVDRVIHLAALAHTNGEDDLSWQRYYHMNVECAKNVFEAAGERPVLYISTVDVYGFANSVVDASAELHPVSNYGKSKQLAEEECQRICPHYSIFRLSPIYTDTIKRDIQKRYYLKYPNIAYRIGAGMEYEILNIKGAVKAMTDWCESEAVGDIHIIKDEQRMNTADYIRQEKAEGRAKIVLYFPKWMVTVGYKLLKGLTGENNSTYLLNKALYPLRSR